MKKTIHEAIEQLHTSLRDYIEATSTLVIPHSSANAAPC